MPIDEIVAVEYVEREPEQRNEDIEMISVNATAFRLHVIKRVPKHIWKIKSVELHCASSAQCALWVDTIRSMLDKCKCAVWVDAIHCMLGKCEYTL